MGFGERNQEESGVWEERKGVDGREGRDRRKGRGRMNDRVRSSEGQAEAPQLTSAITPMHPTMAAALA